MRGVAGIVAGGVLLPIDSAEKSILLSLDCGRALTRFAYLMSRVSSPQNWLARGGVLTTSKRLRAAAARAVLA